MSKGSLPDDYLKTLPRLEDAVDAVFIENGQSPISDMEEDDITIEVENPLSHIYRQSADLHSDELLLSVDEVVIDSKIPCPVDLGSESLYEEVQQQYEAPFSSMAETHVDTQYAENNRIPNGGMEIYNDMSSMEQTGEHDTSAPITISSNASVQKILTLEERYNATYERLNELLPKWHQAYIHDTNHRRQLELHLASNAIGQEEYDANMAREICKEYEEFVRILADSFHIN